MEDTYGSSNGPMHYRMTVPAVLAFVVCMLSIYLLGQHVYRYGSSSYAQSGPVFSEADDAGGPAAAVAVGVATPHVD